MLNLFKSFGFLPDIPTFVGKASAHSIVDHEFDRLLWRDEQHVNSNAAIKPPESALGDNCLVRIAELALVLNFVQLEFGLEIY